MMGDEILVAPLFAGEKSRKVYLPAGKWYDFYTGELVGGNEEITIAQGLDRIPLFVKDGAVIPMIPARRHAPAGGEKLPLTVRHYGTKPGKFILYDDDGLSFNYEKGDYSFVILSVTKNADGKLSGSISEPAMGKPFGYAKEVNWVFMTK